VELHAQSQGLQSSHEFLQTADVTYKQAAIDAAKNRMDELVPPLTQRDLAAKAGVDLKTVSNFLTGKTWPRALQRGRIEAALDWPNGTLAAIAAGGPIPGGPQTGEDPNEETLRTLPYLLPEDRDLFVEVYRVRRDQHTARRLQEYERLRESVMESTADPEVRDRIAANFETEMEKLRRAGYERVRNEIEP
jgi:transcriptional regulator with XRE-family HTH domain